MVGVILFCLLITSFVSVCGMSTFRSAAFEGVGSIEKPYEIWTEEDLIRFSDVVSRGETSACAKLMCHIQMKNRQLWIPIGSEDAPYNGTFDGQYYVISGLEYETSDSYSGLFGVIGENGIITGVGLENITYTAGSYVGGVAGKNGGIIRDCFCEGNITSKKKNAGGIAGENIGVIENCYHIGSVIARDPGAGGIVGANPVAKTSVFNTYHLGEVFVNDANSDSSSHMLIGGHIASDVCLIENCFYLNSDSNSAYGTDIFYDENSPLFSAPHKDLDFQNGIVANLLTTYAQSQLPGHSLWTVNENKTVLSAFIMAQSVQTTTTTEITTTTTTSTVTSAVTFGSTVTSISAQSVLVSESSAQEGTTMTADLTDASTSHAFTVTKSTTFTTTKQSTINISTVPTTTGVTSHKTSTTQAETSMVTTSTMRTTTKPPITSTFTVPTTAGVTSHVISATQVETSMVAPSTTQTTTKPPITSTSTVPTTVSVTSHVTSTTQAETSMAATSTMQTTTKPLITSTSTAPTTAGVTSHVTSTTQAETSMAATSTTRTTTKPLITSTYTISAQATNATSTTVSTITTTRQMRTPSTIFGDLDMDNRIGMSDLILLNKANADLVSLSEDVLLNADCNADGKCDGRDCIVLSRYLICLIDALPDIA